MIRDIWSSTLSAATAPPWPCPHCGKQTLRLTPNSLQSYETALSEAAHAHEDWDPDWISEVFVAWLKCSDPKCGQHVAIVGNGGYEPGFDADQGMEWHPVFRPQLLHPMPDMIELPKKCPDTVVDELRAAFRLFWCDPASAANRMRIAIERLLDHLGVKKRVKDRNGQLVDLSLHKRIQEFSKAEPDIGSHLLALKWLGNTGSHSSAVNGDDILDALEVTEHCLAETLSQRSKHIASLAKKLTKRHAPRPKK